ncbi:MAG: hypothetical protein KGD73_06690 [Candidatus Lokiarchaeota archaeon]|nr:hypothetical protein [Candidatus Lokiarchaeota archaeon]
MSSERNVDMFSGLVLILSIIALVMLIIGPFAGTWQGGNIYWYSCLDCENSTIGDYTSQIFILILLIFQIIIAVNELLPKKLISRDMTLFGLLIAIMIFGFSLIGLISFGVYYDYAEWWVDIGFYGPVVAGVINTILLYLKHKNK